MKKHRKSVTLKSNYKVMAINFFWAKIRIRQHTIVRFRACPKEICSIPIELQKKWLTEKRESVSAMLQIQIKTAAAGDSQNNIQKAQVFCRSENTPILRLKMSFQRFEFLTTYI